MVSRRGVPNFAGRQVGCIDGPDVARTFLTWGVDGGISEVADERMLGRRRCHPVNEMPIERLGSARHGKSGGCQEPADQTGHRDLIILRSSPSVRFGSLLVKSQVSHRMLE